ncbi:hypothetical protein SAMN04488092_11642 [Thalassovita taeanensis]|uniref:Uncharacterized protein n=1 Tax=Thalassovita taeanensis TaxID=657014 RepID=A0A1H9JV83_9RHOB|nr:hypothetical protein SAMN04488092_11642 [Thalassovita taeanensis]
MEARHKAAADKPKGVIGGLPKTYIEDVDGVLYLRRPETPTGQPFAEYARKQQQELQAELLCLFANTTDEAPPNVGIVNNPAPLKPGEKSKNFIHLADGTEIKLQRN